MNCFGFLLVIYNALLTCSVSCILPCDWSINSDLNQNYCVLPVRLSLQVHSHSLRSGLSPNGPVCHKSENDGIVQETGYINSSIVLHSWSSVFSSTWSNTNTSPLIMFTLYFQRCANNALGSVLKFPTELGDIDGLLDSSLCPRWTRISFSGNRNSWVLVLALWTLRYLLCGFLLVHFPLPWDRQYLAPIVLIQENSSIFLSRFFTFKNEDIPEFTSHFVFCLFVSRLFTFFFWLSTYKELNIGSHWFSQYYSGQILICFQIVQLLLMTEYVYFYIVAYDINFTLWFVEQLKTFHWDFQHIKMKEMNNGCTWISIVVLWTNKTNKKTHSFFRLWSVIFISMGIVRGFVEWRGIK